MVRACEFLQPLTGAALVETLERKPRSCRNYSCHRTIRDVLISRITLAILITALICLTFDSSEPQQRGPWCEQAYAALYQWHPTYSLDKGPFTKVPGTKVLETLRKFAKDHGLEQHTHFHTEVTTIKRVNKERCACSCKLFSSAGAAATNLAEFKWLIILKHPCTGVCAAS